MNNELRQAVQSFLEAAEEAGDLVIAGNTHVFSNALTKHVEGFFPASLTEHETEGLVSLIREALWGASKFYDDEMRGTLVGLKEDEFVSICKKLKNERYLPSS